MESREKVGRAADVVPVGNTWVALPGDARFSTYNELAPPCPDPAITATQLPSGLTTNWSLLLPSSTGTSPLGSATAVDLVGVAVPTKFSPVAAAFVVPQIFVAVYLAFVDARRLFPFLSKARSAADRS